MSSRSTLQKPDAQFLSHSNTINTECHEHQTEWTIDSGQLQTFDGKLEAANTAYAANSDLSKKNATTSEHKKATFAELKNFLGAFINTLEGNLNVPDEALARMALRPRHHHAFQPLPRPADAPVISLHAQHDEITVYASRPEHDQPTATVAPADHFGFIIRYKKEGDAGYKTVVSSRLHHTLFFEQEDEGKRVYLAAAWVNHRLEEGPWCPEISQVIS
ncbi:MAG: hypothetical protein LBG17_07400 [Bacteroidales bacterium]|jgi:hypothetical protein|nr:hypothetical protein [Bacteroidales bacterium]